MNFDVLTEAFAPFAQMLPWLAIAVFVGIVLDYVTGTIAAHKLKEWSSAKAREGIWHKVGIIIAILLSALIDVVVIVLTNNSIIQLSFPYFGLFMPMVAVFYTLTEIGSVLENLKKIGVYVPSFLTKGFASIKNVVESHADNTSVSTHEKPPDANSEENNE